MFRVSTSSYQNRYFIFTDVFSPISFIKAFYIQRAPIQDLQILQTFRMHQFHTLQSQINHPNNLHHILTLYQNMSFLINELPINKKKFHCDEKNLGKGGGEGNGF